nr:hypothetical protein [uncultured Rikenella sp.]
MEADFQKGMLEVGADFGGGAEDEVPPGDLWVGDGEAWGVEDEGVVEEDVEVDGARLVEALSVGGILGEVGGAAEAVFDLLEGVEQAEGAGGGLEEEDLVQAGVHGSGVGKGAPGFGLVFSGGEEDRAEGLGDLLPGGGEQSLGFVGVAAEGEQDSMGVGHGFVKDFVS